MRNGYGRGIDRMKEKRRNPTCPADRGMVPQKRLETKGIEHVPFSLQKRRFLQILRKTARNPARSTAISTPIWAGSWRPGPVCPRRSNARSSRPLKTINPTARTVRRNDEAALDPRVTLRSAGVSVSRPDGWPWFSQCRGGNARARVGAREFIDGKNNPQGHLALDLRIDLP